MILDLDTLTEVQTIEAIDSIQDPDHMVDTGLRMFTSRTDVEDDKKTTTRTYIKSNENGNLLFKRVLSLYHDNTKKVYNYGSLYRTHTETDLYELQQISDALVNNQKLPEIDRETILCTFAGHTIFSIF